MISFFEDPIFILRPESLGCYFEELTVSVPCLLLTETDGWKSHDGNLTRFVHQGEEKVSRVQSSCLPVATRRFIQKMSLEKQMTQIETRGSDLMWGKPFPPRGQSSRGTGCLGRLYHVSLMEWKRSHGWFAWEQRLNCTSGGHCDPG